MRPLIDILEDERMLDLKLEAVCRRLTKTSNYEEIEFLYAKKDSIKRDLNQVRDEIRYYFKQLND